MNRLTKLGWFTLGAVVTIVITACSIVAFVTSRQQKKEPRPNKKRKHANSAPEPPTKKAPATDAISIDWNTAPGTRSVWLANKTSAVAHSTSTCSNMIKPVESTKSEVDERGLRPCLNCWVYDS